MLRLSFVAVAGLAVAFSGCGGSQSAPTGESSAASKPAPPAMLQTAEAVNDDVGGTKVTPASASRTKGDPKAPLSPEAVAAFERLVKAYRNEDPDTWMAADAELQKMGIKAAPVLGKGLKTGDGITRELAAMTLARMGTDAEPALDALVAALKDDSSLVRANAASAVSLFPDHTDDVLPVLREFLDESGPSLRKLAIYSLGNVGPKAASEVPKLVKFLDSDDVEMQTAVAMSLGNIGAAAKPALPKLEELAKSDNENLKTVAAEAVRKINAPPEANVSAPSPADKPEAKPESEAKPEPESKKPADEPKPARDDERKKPADEPKPIAKPEEAKPAEKKSSDDSPGPKLFGPSGN